MSTLTKVLIILLTVSSIFLSAVVIVYVANADNYKDMYSKQRSQMNAFEKKATNAEQNLQEQIDKNTAMEKRLGGQITELKKERDIIRDELNSSKREVARLTDKVANFAATTQDFTAVNDKQLALLKQAQDDLFNLQAKYEKVTKELNETADTLMEKMAIIETLTAEKRQLAEQKSELQARLDKYLMPRGEQAPQATPVTQTPERTAVPVVQAPESQVKIQGLVKNVDQRNSLVGISVGKADGVKEGMKFYVTRGDEFICEILIIETDQGESVGVMDLVQQQPQVGDTVSNNLL